MRRRVALALVVGVMVSVSSHQVLATNNTGRIWVAQQYSIYNFAPRYYFESDFPTQHPSGNCRSRVHTGVGAWNALQRELHFEPGTGYNRWIIVKWDDLLWPWNDNVGFTSVSTNSNNRILDANVNINSDIEKAEGGSFSWYCGTGTPGSNSIDMISVAVHEFGHAVELNHTSNPEDSMYPTVGAGSTHVRTLSLHDRESLRAMYASAS